ncbi:hypothetical protein J3L16_00435 [Alteromonas sp. 5E99-2]|uniref:hypothetical protein n=1 Tax=Alteromonas sp. 5E99-2 TaxID=2817683 RepID=UPI001A98C5B0|nr:hypothetical protein [Alteromonas sp. 5E99-2]MBO1254144.1 hypothetical protein [Alteromonas sp. 5E99-2]
MSTLSRTPISAFFTRILLFIDAAFWPNDHKADSSTYTFFQYKGFPAELKRSEVNHWAALQAKLLNPFKSSHSYFFISTHGVHIWFSKTEINGIPETALQNTLKDGTHLLKGEQFLYKQQWQDGVMTSCIVTPMEHDSSSTAHIDISNLHWATRRKIDKVIASPFSWACVVAFLFSMVLTWVLISSVSYGVQRSSLENKINNASSALNSKLNQESQVRATIQALTALPAWRKEYGSFPEAYGIVASSLLKNGSFSPNNIRWQNAVFELEFQSDDMNLPDLVSSLESSDEVENVNVRPHNNENTWVLEVTLK